MSVFLGDTRMWNGQEARSESKGNVRVDSIYGEDSEQALLTGLESMEELTYTGRATGNRLSKQSEYSNDPLDALAEWVIEMEQYVNGNQGTGYVLDDRVRSQKYNVVVQMFGWQRTAGEKYAVDWDLSALWGKGMMSNRGSTSKSFTTSTSWSLDGNDLDSIQAHRQQKKQEVEQYPIAYANAGENEVLSKSGGMREIMIRGMKVGNLDSFEENIQALIGQDNIVTFSEGFPGRDLDVMVKSFTSTRASGRERTAEYTLELVEGEA